MKHYPSVLRPLAPPPPSPGEAEATCALQVEAWWLHCWTESDAHGAVIPAVINISGRFPVPSLLLHVKYPRATLRPHFNYSLKVISGWNQYWSREHYKWITGVFFVVVWGRFTTPGRLAINDNHCGSLCWKHWMKMRKSLWVRRKNNLWRCFGYDKYI